jgi:CSLREA domain-containing protein
MKKSMKFLHVFTMFFLYISSGHAAIYTVTDTLDTNTSGTLRKAMNDANSNPGLDTIQIIIPGTWQHNIILSSALPNITGPVLIDGTTQAGFISGTQTSYVKIGRVYTGTIFTATSITGITIKGLDISYSNPRTGTGISFSSCNQTNIIDNFIRNRNRGISISGGQDHTIQNNDLVGTSSDFNNAALHLSSITEGSIPKGILASGNKFGSGLTALRIQSMDNLLIGDENVAGANIKIEDNSGLTGMGQSGHYVFYFIQVNNITIDNIDLSYLSGGQNHSVGIVIDNNVSNSTFTIKNCSIKNRYEGIRISNGKDYTITNNDLRATGENAQYAVSLSNITAAAIPGGILMSGNLWGISAHHCRGGLKISSMNNLIIGDENVAGANIKIEDNSGFNTIEGNNSGDRGALFLQNVSNITIDNIDASYSLGGAPNSFAIRINNGPSHGNITVKNCILRNRYIGLYCNDGKDYTVTGNDFRGSGWEDVYGLFLNSIAEGTIPGGILVHSNLYGVSPTGVNPTGICIYLGGMSNLTIGDATTGVQVKIEDNSGLNTFQSNTADRRGALYLDDVSNVIIDDLDLSCNVVTNSFGLYVENETSRYSGFSTPHKNIVIKNCLIRNRSAGIRVRGGKDYTIFNNDLRGSGHNNYWALELGNIQPGNVAGGVLVYSNLFGTNGAQVSNGGVYVNSMHNLIIGDAATGVHIKLEDNSGLNQVAGSDVNNTGALYLNSVSNFTIDNVDCSKVPAGQGNSWGIRVANSATLGNITINNCLAGNRRRGIWVDNGKDYTITNNNMVGSGDGQPAFELSNIIPGTIPTGIIASGNTFGTPNFNRGVVISNMRNLLIGDASVTGANIVLEDNSGLNQCVGTDYNSNGALYLSAVDSLTIDNVDCSKATGSTGNSYGILVSNAVMNQWVTIKNCKADNRYRGIYCSGGKDYKVFDNTITNSGWDGTANALDMRDVTEGSLTGGVLVYGNTFGNVPITSNVARAAVRFDNMRDLTIGDAGTGGNVKFEDGNGFSNIGFDQNSNYYVISLNNVTNSSINDVDISSAYTSPSIRNGGIRISNSLSNGFINITNCNIQNRRTGLYLSGGKDYTVTGNNFTGSGSNNSESAVYISGTKKSSLDAGISMSGNTFGGTNANVALRVENLDSLTIGDNTVVGADIVFEDGDLSTVGNNANSNESVIYCNQVNKILIDNVHLSRNGATPYGCGITVSNGNGNKDISIINCGISNRRTGIFCSGGLDYTIQNDTLTSSGITLTEPAIYCSGVIEGSLPGGVTASGNIFGGTNANNAMRFETMKNIVVGDASVSNRTITIEDGALTTVGNNANSNDAVLYFSNVSNTTVDNIDLTRTGATQYGIGLRVDNNANFYPFTIKNSSISTRRTGIYANVISGLTIDSNSISSCGSAAAEPAIYLLNTSFSAGKSMHHNTFSGTYTHGLRLENINDVIIGDSSVVNVEIQLEPYCGINTATTRAIHLENTNRVEIELVSLSLTGTASGTGLYVMGGSFMRARSLTIQKRVDGIDLVSGNNHTVQCSDLSLNTDALQIAAAVSSMTIEQNSFTGNTGYAINSAATVKAENNYFGGGAPPIGTPNGVTASVDADPYLSTAPTGCPSTTLPEIEVSGNFNLIEDGTLTTSTSNYTDFNSTKVSVPVVRTFLINNRGSMNLNISSITFSGSQASEFVVGALNPASPIPPGDSATFTVTFTPTATGARNATLNIANDDADESAFDAAVKGTGKAALVVTKIADTNDGVCDTDCSLREAMTVANSSADADVIEFNVAGGGAQTIVLSLGTLPTIIQPLIIDGSTQPGFAGTALITLNTTNGSTTFSANSVTGLTIKFMDISRPNGNYDGYGIDLNSCNEVSILNNIILNRYRSVTVSGGRDITIENNDFRQTGLDFNNPIVWINGVLSRNIPGGIKMSNNLYGDAAGGNRSRFGFRITAMNNLIIGDASVANANIKIEDGSGFWAVGTGDNYCFYLETSSNITLDNLDLSATTYGYQGWGIVVACGTAYHDFTIKNCKINNRYSAIYCTGGKDYTIQNNNIQNCGNDISRPALWLNGLTEANIPKGILASGNLFGSGTSRIGLRIDNMSNLLIGNQTVPGANITLEDASGIAGTGSGGDYYCIYLGNVSNTTIDKVDLNSTIGYTGHGIRFENSYNNSNNTIKNCKINNRYVGIYCGSGKDYTVLNNDLTNTGNDNSRPALWFNNVRSKNIPMGIAASGNLFGGGSARTALRVDGTDGLIVGDASVAGAHIVIEDNSGANNLNNGDGTAVFYFVGTSNLTVDNVDVSRSFGGREGWGIYLENGSNAYRNFTIKNCSLKQHHVSLWVNGGKDLTLTNNDFRYSGWYEERPTIFLNNITAGSLPGGISMSGNLFGGSFNGSIAHFGIRFDNMRDLVIGDITVPGRNITIEDNSGMNEIVGEDANNRGCIRMNSVRNIVIDNVDFSKATGGQANSYALYLNACLNSVVKNTKGSNRYKGFHFNAGRDYTIFSNDLTGSGQSISYPGLYFSNVQAQAIPIGVSAYLNTFGGANVRTALRVDNMRDLIVGDASVTGAHIILEDNCGVNNLTITDNNSNNPILSFNTVSNFTIDNVDASRPGVKDRGAIWISNSSINSNVTIKNCNFNNSYRGLYCSGGRDYTILNNTLLNSGWTNDQPAIYLQNIQEGSLPGGILMSGNTFGGATARGGVRIEGMRDLIIGDTSVAGRNITLEDNCGLNNHSMNLNSSAYYLLHLVNVNNVVVDSIDVSRPIGATPAQDMVGIRVDNSSDYGPVTIKNCDARRHRIGISLSGGQNYTITNNDLRGSGTSSDDPALYVNSISQLDATIPMGLAASGNKFGASNGLNTNCGIRLENLCGIKITNTSGAGNHVVVTLADSLYKALGNAGSTPGVIVLRNTTGVTIDSLNLNFTGSQTGTGIYCNNDAAGQYGNTFSNNLIKNRRMGIRINNGADYTISGNDFQTTGIADDEPAIRIEHVAEGNFPGGLDISNNMFGGTNALFGLKFVNMSNLKISNGTFPGTNVNLGLYGTNGLSEVSQGSGYVLHLSSVCNVEVNTLDLSRSGIVRQGTGIRLTNGVGNIIQKVYAQGRDIGLQVNGSSSEMIKCNTFYDNNFGMDFMTPAISGMSLINNSLMCNATGLRSTTPGTLNAMANYWGAPNGPSNLGGGGNGYTGSVDASGFLNEQNACAPPLPNTDALGNAMLIDDGDMTPSFNDNTLVCGIPVGQESIVDYTIKNDGGGIIRLNGPSPVTTVPATVFTVVTQPADLELAPGESTIVSIKFAPTSVGLFTATVNISNRSCNNNPYDFTIQGNGCDPYTAALSRDTAVCIGNPSSVKITITGGAAPFNVTLSDGSVHIVNSTGIHYLVVSPVVTTNYTITRVYDANNCCADLSGSSQTTINALPTPTIVLTENSGNSANDGIICASSTALLDAGAYTSWSWSTSATTQTITTNVSGTYTVTVTDANGCTATDTEDLIVNPNPTPTITVSETSGTTDNDGILCSGDAADLNAGAYTSWLWSTSATTQTINTNMAGTYTVTVTDANGCTGTDQQLIVVNPLPAASLTNDLLVCPGTTSVLLNINVTAGTAPLTVILSDASSHNVTSTGVSQITVTVEEPGPDIFTISSIEDANGCSGTGSGTATVNFGSAGEIEISGLGIPISDGDMTPDISDDTDYGQVGIDDEETHTFTITNSHATEVLSISGVTISGSSKFTLVSSPAGSVSANGGTTTFSVKFAPTGLGVQNATILVSSSDCDENPYDFAVKGEGICIDPDFTVCPGPITGNNDAGVCNAIITYTATATGTPAPTYTYSFAGATSGSGSGTGSGLSFNVGVTTVTVTASNVCSSDVCVFTVTIADTEAPDMDCPGNQSKNAVSSCQYTASGSEFNPVSVTDNCPTTISYTLTGATTGTGNTSLNGIAFNLGVTTVEWKVTDISNNTNTCSFTVTVNNNQSASISVTETSEVSENDAIVCSGDPASLTASTGSAYIWSTSETTNSITVNPTSTSTYTVTVTVANGCTATATQTITTTALPVVTCPGDMKACLQGGNVVLSGATPTGGTYSGLGVSGGIFDPTVEGVGTYTLSYTYTDPVTQCSNTCTFEMEVFSAPIYNMTDDLYYCTIEEAVMAALTGDGDELQIPAGVYMETCIHISKTLKLKPMGGMVTIDCIMMEGPGKKVTLLGDITINELTLTDGHLHTNGYNLKCQVISGGHINSYIVTD